MKIPSTPLPLLQAILHDDVALVRTLLTQGGIDINGKLGDTNATYLCFALLKGNKEIITLLLENGAGVNIPTRGSGFTPLHQAVYKEPTDIELVRLLLAHGADVHARTMYGAMPLHLAVSLGHLEVIQLLLDFGADIHAQDGMGRNVLHQAFEWCAHNKLETIKLLLENHANVDVPNAYGMTLLHHAAGLEWPELITLLLSFGAQVNAQDQEGDTALHVAARKGFADIAQLLLNHGADVHIKNNNGKTPYMIAVKKGHTEVAKLLE